MPGPYPKVGDRLEKLLQVEKFPPPAELRRPRSGK